uniref:Putative E3 ubiquitin-protein ligase UBR7 n=1 Tax=Monopterus albus TaxID=43700 RepID=A0A3Q3QFP7_MONAL
MIFLNSIQKGFFCLTVSLCVVLIIQILAHCVNFRCDCGNGKFRGFRCQLIPTKDEENIRNHYNHNFSGCYCTCDRPYPDTDDRVDDEMIQCVICEDWFHTRHLGCNVVEPEELLEMVCEPCMNKAPFLWMYAAYFAAVSVASYGLALCTEGIVKSGLLVWYLTACCAHFFCGSCQVSLLAKGPERLRQGAVFWPYSWRSKLCTCTSCKKAYVAAEVQFLMDQLDTVEAYEKRGLDKPFGQHLLMALTSSMDHVQQLEVIFGECGCSLSPRMQSCKTVTVEAVHQFFEELQDRKRRRISAVYE